MLSNSPALKTLLILKQKITWPRKTSTWQRWNN